MSSVLVDTGARSRLLGLFKQLEERIPDEALRPTVEAMAIDAAKRAPTPQQEYRTMMFGGYSTANFAVTPYVGGAQGFAITDTDNRVRFYKSAEMYLKSFVPTSFGVNGLHGWIGNIAALNAASAYSYVNYTVRNGQSYTHEVKHPFWLAWEYGGLFTVQPAYQYNHPYPLRPAANVKTFTMQKAIPALGMYRGVVVDAFVERILLPRIRRIARSI